MTSENMEEGQGQLLEKIIEQQQEEEKNIQAKI